MVATEGDAALELSLEFTNTVDWRNGRMGRVAKDGFTDYGELIDWSVKKGLLREGEARRLARVAKETGKDRPTLRRAVVLRESIYRIFSAVAHKKTPEDRDLEMLGGFVSESVARSKLTPSGNGFRWSLSGEEGSPDRMLWPIARSAADLLTSDRLEDVRECANEEEGCGSLFLDCTKNHGKRWCSTTGCGNRAKVRRFYEAHKGEPS